jgi:hypothetical protein
MSKNLEPGTTRPRRAPRAAVGRPRAGAGGHAVSQAR